LALPITTEDILDSFNDLKVLGKREFKAILTWRIKAIAVFLFHE